nr:hypothetical protein [Kibdelosporangium sp. MJ126-NF4]CEL20023.1 hypothetical protein [Kibdelosporangium sp. MJ126-NF4]CTQ97246.1 hypothetical protein [Kibdelosporangium sp. MJ126-NF4]
MRAAAKAGRLGLLLGLLLVLLGLTAAVAPGGGRAVASLTAESASTTQTIRDDLHNRLHLSAVARHTLSTVAPDSPWALCSADTGRTAHPRRQRPGDTGAVWTADTASAAAPSRAPPGRVS